MRFRLCCLAMDTLFGWPATDLWRNFECQSIHLNHQLTVREYQVLFYNILAGSACSMNRRLKRAHSLYWFHCLYTCSLSNLDSNTFNLLATWLARCICDLGLCYLAMDISFCWLAFLSLNEFWVSVYSFEPPVDSARVSGVIL